jgi:hypothetical protein
MIGLVTWGKAWQLAKNTYFEVVREFVYLGSLMTPTNDVSLEIQRRIQTVQISAVEPPFTPDKIHHSQDLDPPSPAQK